MEEQQSCRVRMWDAPPESTMRDSYCARSLRMVRIMIMATMHDMTTTTIMELRMLNQCTCTHHDMTVAASWSAWQASEYGSYPPE